MQTNELGMINVFIETAPIELTAASIGAIRLSFCGNNSSGLYNGRNDV